MKLSFSWVAVASLASILSSGSTLAAESLSVWPGQTKVLTVSAHVASVDAEDPSRVAVEKMGGGRVALTGKSLGQTAVHVRMPDGEEFELQVHVVSEGGRLYRTDGRSMADQVGPMRVQLSGSTTTPAAKPEMETPVAEPSSAVDSAMAEVAPAPAPVVRTTKAVTASPVVQKAAAKSDDEASVKSIEDEISTMEHQLFDSEKTATKQDISQATASAPGASR